MKQRCSNPKAKKYALYGGRGIKVCDEWRNSYVVFHEWATSNGYQDTLTLDRISGDGNYEPKNCRWATRSEQSRNTSQNRLLLYRGEQRPLVEWAEIVGINARILRQRLDRYRWPVERALSTPSNWRWKR